MVIAKINRAVAEVANHFHLGVDEDDTEELLEVVSEVSTKEEMLKLNQEHIAKEGAREKETAGEKKQKDPQENSQ